MQRAISLKRGSATFANSELWVSSSSCKPTLERQKWNFVTSARRQEIAEAGSPQTAICPGSRTPGIEDLARVSLETHEEAQEPQNPKTYTQTAGSTVGLPHFLELVEEKNFLPAVGVRPVPAREGEQRYLQHLGIRATFRANFRANFRILGFLRLFMPLFFDLGVLAPLRARRFTTGTF